MPLNKDDYRQVLFAQDACSLFGVVHSLNEVIPLIREEPDCTGTDFVNNHPIVVMYVGKLLSLSNADDALKFVVAYDLCQKRSE